MERYVAEAWEALVAAAVDAVCGGFADASIRHEDVIERSRVVRDEIAARNLLGSKLHALAAGFAGEVEQRSLKRLTDQWNSPSLAAGALIDEVRGSDAGVLKAVTNRPVAATTRNDVDLATTLLRAHIVAVAAQPDSIADPPRSRSPGMARGEKNRREIGIGDLPAELLDPICHSADAGADWREYLRPLEALEKTAANASSIVTKVLALPDAPDGRRYINEIAERIRGARFSAPDETLSKAPASEVLAECDPTVADGTAPLAERRSAPVHEAPLPVRTTVSPPPVIASEPPAIELWPPETGGRADPVVARLLLEWLKEKADRIAYLFHADARGRIRLSEKPHRDFIADRFAQAIDHPDVQARLHAIVAGRGAPA